MGGNLSGGALMPSRPWLYLPDGWNSTWDSAKSNINSTPAWVTVMGDSYSEGVQSTDFFNLCWFQLLRNQLRTRYSLYGDYWHVSESDDYMQWSSGISYNGTPPFVVSSTNRSTYGAIGWLRLPQYTGTAVGAIAFTTPYACTDLDVIPFDNVAGTFDISIDGGAATTVTLTGAGYHKRIQFTGLANTTHTVVIGNQSADNVMLIEGVATYNSRTTGLGFAKMAPSGHSLYLSAFGGVPSTNKLLQWQGKAASATGFGFPVQSALFLMALGINDCQSDTLSPVTYKLALNNLLQAVRRGYQDASIVILTMCFPDGISSDTVSSGTNPQNWPIFTDIQMEAARRHHCALVNFQAKWGELGGTLGFQTAGNFHPTDTGHADIASILEKIL